MTPNFAAELETYLRHLAADRDRAVPETSRYGYLQTLLNAVGEQLPARVRAVIHPANRGAGIPDLGLYAADQPDDALPTHGVVEAKPTTAAVRVIALDPQVLRYLRLYRLVVVTNYFQFLLVTLGDDDQQRLEEEYRLAADEAAFWQALQDPRSLARRHAPALLEYLSRAAPPGAPAHAPGSRRGAGLLCPRGARPPGKRRHPPAHAPAHPHATGGGAGSPLSGRAG